MKHCRFHGEASPLLEMLTCLGFEAVMAVECPRPTQIGMFPLVLTVFNRDDRAPPPLF